VGGRAATAGTVRGRAQRAFPAGAAAASVCTVFGAGPEENETHDRPTTQV